MMNTNLQNLGKRLGKENLKKIVGGMPPDNNGMSGIGCIGGCQCCKATSTTGSGTTYSFCSGNGALIDSWANTWSNFGYEIHCITLQWT